MELQGRIKKVFETQNVTASFKKRELVITTNEQYPQDILIEFAQDKCDVLNSSKEGDEVVVGINLRGREWVNPDGVAKYFNSIQGWKINLVSQGQQNDNLDFGAPQQEEDDNDLPY